MHIIHCARGRITTHFGDDIGRGFPHRGIDLGHGDATADDLRILAPASGRVIAVGRDGTYGLRILIDHGDGWTSLIAHLASCRVKAGDDVTQGEDIAVMGNSGTVYVHAHQELRFNGVPVDPELHLTTTTPAATVAAAAERIIMADFAIQAIEQNQSPGQPGYLQIVLYGPGFYDEVAPTDRDRYNVLRGVTAAASRDMGGTFTLPANATSVDAIAYDAIKRTFGRYAA
jgi:hypothetical protein